MSMTTSSTTNTISLTYGGYWREPNVGSVPNEAGVYSVYACTNPAAGTVSIRSLLYIGESANVRDRIRQHLSGATGRSWKKHLHAGEQLCFAFAAVSGRTRERAEAALIYKHKPPENSEYVNSFPARWSPTTVKTGGKNAKLSSLFTVRAS